MSVFKSLCKKHKIDIPIPKDCYWFEKHLQVSFPTHNHLYQWSSQESYYSGCGLTYAVNDSVIYKQAINSKTDPYLFVNQTEILKDLNLPFSLYPIKSRIAVMDGNQKPLGVYGWHVDENPYEVLRINIPIVSEGFFLELDGMNPIEMKSHTAYSWNTLIPHRIQIQSSSKRIALVLGYSVWFEYVDGNWVPNKYFGKNIQEILSLEFSSF